MNQQSTIAPGYDLQKQLLQENRAFLEAVKNRLPLNEILEKYDKVKDIMNVMSLQPKEYQERKQ
jgi:hypothetical protein